MVREHVIEKLTVDDQDVIEIVQVVQVFSYEVAQFAPIPVPGERITISAWNLKLGPLGLESMA